MRKLIVILFLPAAFFMRAQDYRAEWKKVMKAYTCENYSMEMDIKIVPIERDGEIVHYAGSVKRAVNHFFSSVQGITTVVGDEYNISVNEHQRIISFSKIERGKKADSKKNEIEALTDSALSNPPKLKSKNSREMVYVKNYAAGELYNSMEITVSIADSHITKIIYYYRKNADQAYDRVEISYRNVELGKAPDKKWFSAEQYFTFKKNTAIASQKYAGYKIIDQQNLISSSYEK